METTIRGMLEKEIDTLITPKTLGSLFVAFQRFPIKSMEDSLFGFVVGFIYCRFLVIKASPTEEEMKELMEMIERRTMEIKGKIKLVMGR